MANFLPLTMTATPQSWKFDHDDYDPFASRSSWSRQEFRGDGFKKGKSRNKGQQACNTSKSPSYCMTLSWCSKARSKYFACFSC